MSTPPPTPDPRQQPALLALGLAVFAGLCVFLGRGPFLVGPSDWDDMLYCDYAASGAVSFELRNRYVHIWALRLSDLLFGSRLDAGTAYSTALVIGIGWLAFFLARRIAGTAAGLLAMFSMALFPPVLRYISVPHVDLTLCFWVLLAILGAAKAIEDDQAGKLARFSWPAALSGMATFLALESKETALPLPALLLYLFVARSERRAQQLAAWAFGIVAGFLVLLGLDAAFSAPGHPFSANPLHYFGSRPASEPLLSLPRPPGAAAENKFMSRDFISELTDTPFWAFSFFGMAGLARRFRSSVTLEALGMWLLGSVALTAIVAFRSWNIQIYDRYLIAPGAVLVIGSAVWLVELWQHPRGSLAEETHNLFWLGPLLVAGLVLVVPPLMAAYSGQLPARDARALFFVLPLVLLLAFLMPWLTPGRFLPLLAAGVALSISLYASIGTAAVRAATERAEMRPWQELAARADQAGASLALWDAAKYPERRVLWRFRTLSRRPIAQVRVRTVNRPEDADVQAWLFVHGCRRADLQHRGFALVIAGSCDARDLAWSVYRKTP